MDETIAATADKRARTPVVGIPSVNLLRWRCPTHNTALAAGDSWVCTHGCAFPALDAISRFVPEDGYSSNFGLQWRVFRRTQLDGTSGLPLSRDRLAANLGRELFASLGGLRVLEVGCGAGRFTEVLLGEGAFVLSTDLSSAVDANALNFPPSKSHVIAQADVRRLPLEGGQFDIVLALGMVQHTPDPEETMRGLVKHVRPGGWLVLDHYEKRLVHRLRLAQLYRSRLKRMDVDRAFARVVTLHDKWSPRHQRARSLLAKKVLVLISPIVYFSDEWSMDAEQRREWGILDTFDSLTDTYKHRRSRKQIRDLFATLPLEDVSIRMVGYVISAKGRRKPTHGPEGSSSAKTLE